MAVNQITCATSGSNTGVPDCSFTMKNIVKVFLVPNDFVLNEAALATPQTALAALQAAAIADSPSARIYPTPEIVGITNNSEAVVTQTLGYGVPVVVRDGKQILSFQYLRGGNCVNNALRRFNNANVKVLFVDADGVLIGTKVGETMKGIPLDVFFANPFTINDGTNVTSYTFQLTFSPSYINEAIAFIQLPVGEVLNIDGLHNVNIVKVSRATNVIKVQTVTGCSKTNLYDAYSTELANVAVWVAKMDGKVVTLTSVAVDDNISGFTITLDTSDPDYVAGSAVLLNLATPSVLATNDLPGFEGVPVTIAP